VLSGYKKVPQKSNLQDYLKHIMIKKNVVKDHENNLQIYLELLQQ
jgi:hypothetical protein